MLQHRICRCVSLHNANYADEDQSFTEQTNNSCQYATNSAELCDYKAFLCITHTVEHNYISPSSTVGIQLHVSALYVGHLQVVIKLTQQLYKMCGVFFEGIGGWVGGPRSRCFISGYRDLGLL